MATAEFSKFAGILSEEGIQMVKNTLAIQDITGLGKLSGEGNGYPLQYSCLENPVDRGAWQATVHGVVRVKHDLTTKPPPLPQLY